MADSPPLGPHELYAYEPPISLWQLIKSYVPQHELQEIKNLLGESLVEQSLELHDEVATLLEIWRDYRSETENNLMYHRLPEPPAARERLTQEIQFFVENLREKTENNGRSFGDVLTKHNKSVLDYVLENKRPESSSGSRPSTASSSRDGHQTPMTITTPDRLCQGAVVSNQVDSIKDNLNFLELDSVVQHLRDTLVEEVQWLLKDIDFLQNCLEDESDFREGPTVSREPSLSDLREERSKLEKELLADDLPRALADINVGPPRQITKPGSAGKVHTRPTPPTTPPQASTRPGPMRASHQISPQVLTISPPSDHGINSEHERKSSTRGPLLPSSQKNIEQCAHGKVSRVRNLLPEAPTHISIRTGNSKIVKIGSIPTGQTDGPKHAPSPPSSAKPSVRPGSAQKFRRMVQDCRDGT